MNKVLALVITLAVASPFAAIALNALGVGPGFHEDAPTWSPGHQWHYDMTLTGRAKGQIFGVAEAETQTARIDATRSLTVLNTEVTDGDTPLYATLQTLGLQRVAYGDETIYDANAAGGDRNGDHELHDGSMEADMVCLTSCERGLMFHTHELNPYIPTDQRVTEELGELRLFDFPLTADKTWTVVAFEDDDITFRIDATAVEEEYIKIDGVGAMRTIRIEAGLSDDTRAALKDALQNEFNGEDLQVDLDFDMTFTYWYAPDIEQVAKSHAEAFVAGRGIGYGAAGAFRIDVDLVETLSDHTLAETEQRDMEEVRHLASAANEMGDEEWSDTAYDFQVSASKRHVRAGSDETITFAITPGNRPGSGNTHLDDTGAATVTWTHKVQTLHGDQRVATHEGAAYQATIDDPGIHTVTALVRDGDGRLMGADAITVEGYTDTTFRIDDPVGLFAVSTQQAFPVDIAPGAATFVATATPQIAGAGSLGISGPGGAEQTSGFGPQTIKATQPVAGEWTTYWLTEAQAGGVEIHAVVRYALDEDRPTTQGTGEAPAAFALLDALGDLPGF